MNDKKELIYHYPFNDPSNNNMTYSHFYMDVDTNLELFFGLLLFSGCFHLIYTNCRIIYAKYKREKKINELNEIISEREIQLLNDRCSICLEYYSKKDKISKLSCGHYFHYKCLKYWLKGNSTCPICRVIIIQ